MFIPCTSCLHILLAHSCLYYYLLSLQHTVLHIILFYILLFYIFYSYFLFSTSFFFIPICMYIPTWSHGIYVPGDTFKRDTKYVPITTYYCSFQNKQTLETVKL